jgi:hypothetical protein
VAGRFPLYADADVRGPFIKALRNAGWDVVRAIDELIEGTDDPPHFERAVEQGRVLVSNDADQEAIAHQWYERGRHFPGLIVWRQALYRQMTTKEILDVLEELARQDAPFAPYPIVRIWPKR